MVGPQEPRIIQRKARKLVSVAAGGIKQCQLRLPSARSPGRVALLNQNQTRGEESENTGE